MSAAFIGAGTEAMTAAWVASRSLSGTEEALLGLVNIDSYCISSRTGVNSARQSVVAVNNVVDCTEFVRPGAKQRSRLEAGGGRSGDSWRG